MSKYIAIATFGSLGDLYPYVAIAKELRTRGYRVVLAASSPLYSYIIESEGIEFLAVRPSGAINLEQDGEFIGLLSYSQQSLDYGISYLIAPHLRATYHDLIAAVGEADLVITHHLAFAATVAAEKTGTPRVSTVLSPASLMSVYDAPSLALATSAYERAMTLVANDAMYRSFRWQARYWSAAVRHLRAELGLPPSGDPFFEGQHSPDLVLGLFSQLLAKPQPDWPPQTKITGFPLYNYQQQQGLSPELEKFLQAGPPSIVFTLGSLVVWTQGNFYLEGAIAAHQLGYRAILLMGNAADNIPPNYLPEEAIAVDYAPHSALFPRAAAIVHHGGVGTTAQALRSGRPMLVVPCAYDQPDNAARLVRLGVARTIDRQHCTADRIAAELKHLLFDPTYAARAAEVGRLVQAEDGTKAAGDAIEAYLDNETSSRRK